MIEEYVKAWEQNKNELKKYIEQDIKDVKEGKKIVFWDISTIGSYRELLELLVGKVLNPYIKDKIDIKNITTERYGDYQGTLVFNLPIRGTNDYIETHNNYGTCSGCDALMGAYEVKDYMRLALHLLQRMKKI